MPWSEKVLAQVAARHHKRKGLHLGPVRRIKQMKKGPYCNTFNARCGSIAFARYSASIVALANLNQASCSTC